jgi:hypothetical protein
MATNHSHNSPGRRGEVQQESGSIEESKSNSNTAGGGGGATNYKTSEPDSGIVVTEHHRNTITVQSTKVVGEFNYSFVSVSPT